MKTTPEPRPTREQWLRRLNHLILTMRVSLDQGEDLAGFILSADHVLATYQTAVAPVGRANDAEGNLFEIGGYGITPEEIGCTLGQALDLWAEYRSTFPLQQPGPKSKLDPMRWGPATGGRWG